MSTGIQFISSRTRSHSGGDRQEIIREIAFLESARSRLHAQHLWGLTNPELYWSPALGSKEHWHALLLKEKAGKLQEISERIRYLQMELGF